jgi:hypothetical protein
MAALISDVVAGTPTKASQYNVLRTVGSSVSASATITPTRGQHVYYCTGGTAGIRLTLTDDADYANCIIDVIKVDSGIGAVTLVPTTGTIGGMSYVFLTEQYQRVSIIFDGTNYQILSGTLYWISGGINTNDWTNRHLGLATVPYDTKSGTFLMGETITEETSGITGVVIADSGTNLTMLKVTGVGYYTNNKTLTGGQSAATALVNTGTTTKNADSDVTHSTGFCASRFDVELWLYAGATFSFDGATLAGRGQHDSGSTCDRNYSIIRVGSNAFKIQTAANYVEFFADDGTITGVGNSDYSYCVVCKLVI